MTLQECIDRLRTRVEVDLESEVPDLDTDDDVAVAALIGGAQKVTRDTFVLFEEAAALTLATNDQKINLLGSQSGPYRIFRVHKDGIYINGGWLIRLKQNDFFNGFNYITATATAKPSHFTMIRDNTALLSSPIDATAAAANNYVRGWREHQTYTSADLASEMEGPEEYHLLYVMQAAIDLTGSYVSGAEARQRRLDYAGELTATVKKLQQDNLSTFIDTRKDRLAGSTRRIVSLGLGN